VNDIIHQARNEVMDQAVASRTRRGLSRRRGTAAERQRKHRARLRIERTALALAGPEGEAA
jgi:hypothetical protein